MSSINKTAIGSIFAIAMLVFSINPISSLLKGIETPLGQMLYTIFPYAWAGVGVAIGVIALKELYIH